MSSANTDLMASIDGVKQPGRSLQGTEDPFSGVTGWFTGSTEWLFSSVCVCIVLNNVYRDICFEYFRLFNTVYAS